MELARLVRIEPEVELVLPAELEARLGQRVIADLRAWVALGEVGRVRGDLVRHDAVLDVDLVGEPQMLLRCDVAKHRGAVPADHCGTDRRGDVIVSGGDVGGERPERVEGRLAAKPKLLVHVVLDQMHRHVAGALDHGLHVVLPGDLRELAERSELRHLRLVVGIEARAWTQSVAKAE